MRRPLRWRGPTTFLKPWDCLFGRKDCWHRETELAIPRTLNTLSIFERNFVVPYPFRWVLSLRKYISAISPDASKKLAKWSAYSMSFSAHKAFNLSLKGSKSTLCLDRRPETMMRLSSATRLFSSETYPSQNSSGSVPLPTCRIIVLQRSMSYSPILVLTSSVFAPKIFWWYS